MRGLDVAPAKVRRGEQGFVHAPAAASRLEEEVAVGVGLCVADGDRSNLAVRQAWLIYSSGVSHPHVLPGETRCSSSHIIEMLKRLVA